MGTANPGLATYSLAERPSYRHRLRLALAVTLYATAVGAASITIYSANRTPLYSEPEHLPALPAAFFALAGAVAGAALAGASVYRICDRTDRPRGVLTWGGLGLAFGVLLPLLTAALLPLSVLLANVVRGFIGLAEFPTRLVEAFFLAPASALIDGLLGLSMAMPAAIAAAAGAWVIDRLNSSQHPAVARWGPWVVAITAGGAMVAFAMLASPLVLEYVVGKRFRV